MKNKIGFKTLVTTCGVVAGISTPAIAQTNPAKPVAAIEEILVTAQKRIENIQDVPKSVDVRSQEDFAKAGINDIRELSQVIPQITATAPGTSVGTAPAVRGIKTITGSIGVQSKTGVLVDEVAQPTFSSLANSLIDVERMELFAGPQSTLSGRNAAAGLLSFTTRAPSHTPELDLGVTITNDGQRRVTGFGTGPLTDDLAFSVSGYADRDEGEVYSHLEHKHLGDSKNEGGRAKLLWEPTDELSATLTAYYIEAWSQALTPLAAGGLDYVSPGAAAAVKSLIPGWSGKRFDQEVFASTHGERSNRDRGLTLHLDYDIDGVGTFTSLTNSQKGNAPSANPVLPQQIFPGGGPSNNVTAYSSIDNKYFSQEFRLVSEDMDPWTYLLGALYSDTEVDQTSIRTLAFTGLENRDLTSDMKGAAVFGRATYSFTEADSLTFGLRYQRDKIEYEGTNNLTKLSYDNNSSYGYWSAEGSFKHDFNNNMNAYLTLAHAETGEAYDLGNNVALDKGEKLDPLDSEKIKSIELGFKSHLFDDRMTFNISAFLTKFENYQMQALQTTATSLVPVQRTFSIGKVDTRGFEFSTSLQASEALRLDFNAALLDAIIKSYPGAPCYASYQTAAQGCVGGVQDLSGSRMPETPRFKYTLGADYTFFLSLPFDIDMGAFYRYQTPAHFDTFNDPYTEQGSFGILNIFAGIRSHDDMYRVKFFVNNVEDKQYYNNLRKDQVLVLFSGNNVVIDGGTDRNAFRYAGVSFDVKLK